MFWLIIFSISILFASSNGQYDNNCLMPNQQSGRCVPIKSCKKTYEFLNKILTSGGGKPTTAERAKLQELQCGYMKNIICDHKLLIRFVDCRYGGASHDSHVWKLSNAREKLKERFERGEKGFWLIDNSLSKLCNLNHNWAVNYEQERANHEETLPCEHIVEGPKEMSNLYKKQTYILIPFPTVPLVCCTESEIQLNIDGLNILKNNTCGIYNVDKVSNGHRAALFGFPWMALLKYNDQRNQFKCGGSIISDRYVLTAAHCVHNLQKSLVAVRLGEYQISTEKDCIKTPRKDICAPPAEDVGIEEIILHEKYVNNLYHDIALIRLDRKLNFQRHIKPICLPIFDNLRNKEYSHYVISGWGTTENGTGSDVLLVAIVPIVDRLECEKILRMHRLRLPLTDGQICAGGKDLVDTCRGDSGGPLGYRDFYNDIPRFIQFGIVSLGLQACGVKNVPTSYTNISYYLQWITDHIR